MAGDGAPRPRCTLRATQFDCHQNILAHYHIVHKHLMCRLCLPVAEACIRHAQNCNEQPLLFDLHLCCMVFSNISIPRVSISVVSVASNPAAASMRTPQTPTTNSLAASPLLPRPVAALPRPSPPPGCACARSSAPSALASCSCTFRACPQCSACPPRQGRSCTGASIRRCGGKRSWQYTMGVSPMQKRVQ